MKFIKTSRIAGALMVGASLSLTSGVAAQQLEPVDDGAQDTILVEGALPSDLSGLPEGPEIEGLISARGRQNVQISSPDGQNSVVAISDSTEIRAKKGFLGLGRAKLDSDSLLNGLPVKVQTVQYGGGLIATKVDFDNSDLETAAMIRSGTSQQFARQGAAIDKNTQAAEALRSRMGDIDKYNIKGTTNVYFDTGKWNLTPAAEAELCSAANQADGMDNALLLVVGYTDSVGSQDYNQVLSERRAGRVVNYLQQACGWKPWRMLTPTGMAEADPAADNTTPSGKAQNRRVAVNILVSKSVDGM